MTIFESLVFFDDRVLTQKTRLSSGPSGSMVADGLYLDDDSSDPTSSVLNSSGSLVTGKISEGCIYNGTTNWSIGIDQGHAYNVYMISLIDEGSAGSGLPFSGSGDSLTLYQSTDNSTWTLVRNYQPLIRGSASGSAMSINILCNTTQQYLKLYADAGPLKSAEGNTLWISGIRTYQESSMSWSSGSYSKPIRATITLGNVIKKIDIVTTNTEVGFRKD